MIFPAIHLNGTSRGQLLEDWCKMAHTVDEAITTLCEYAPNARDYYVHGESVWNTARAEHAERLRKLREVRAELNQIAEYVADQEGGRP